MLPAHPAAVHFLFVRIHAHRTNVDKKNVLENLDLVFMTIDELVDGGCGLPHRVETHSFEDSPPKTD